jgi:hypothetical protein
LSSGIYAAGEQVFRFYTDGTVLDVRVRPAPQPDDAEAIAHWLRRENPLQGMYMARYEQHGARIAFTTLSHLSGDEVKVEGTWVNSRLTLRSTGPGWDTGAQDFIHLHSGRVTSQGSGREATTQHRS